MTLVCEDKIQFLQKSPLSRNRRDVAHWAKIFTSFRSEIRVPFLPTSRYTCETECPLYFTLLTVKFVYFSSYFSPQCISWPHRPILFLKKSQSVYVCLYIMAFFWCHVLLEPIFPCPPSPPGCQYDQIITHLYWS